MKKINNNIIENEFAKIRQQLHRTESDWNGIIDIINDMKVNNLTCPEEIYIKLGIPRKTFNDQLKINPQLSEAYDTLLVRIGIELNKYCRKKNLSMSSVMANELPDFLERFRNNIEWRNKLKEQTEDNKAKVVIIEKFASE